MKNNKGFWVVIILLIIIVLVLIIGNNINWGKPKVVLPLASEEEILHLQENQNNPQQDLVENPVCNIGYKLTDESKVLSETSPALITSFEKKCDGNYYFTFDYLAIGGNNLNSGGYLYTNDNTKLREFKIDSNLKVRLTNNTEVPLSSFASSLEKAGYTIYNQNNAYIRKGPIDPGIPSPLFTIVVKNGIVISMTEEYQP
jgi:hypothetical protein